MDLFNWYIKDGFLFGDLCLINMRQNEFRIEKNKYKDSDFIKNNDIKYKKKFRCEDRSLLFVKLNILNIENLINDSNEKIINVTYEKKTEKIKLQNMDGFFYFDEDKRINMKEKLDKYIND